MDVFQGETSQFDPNLAGPVDENYRVGPGDRLMLILSGQVEAAYSLDVTREGFVVVPQVGRIDVSNLTLGQIDNLMFDRLGRVYSEIKRGPEARTRFSISPVRLRSNQIYVVGDVARPGSYRVSSAGTVLTALYAAGGPTLTGTLRNVVVRRAGRLVSSLDVYAYLLRGDASKDVRLENGDVVFVGVHGPRVEVRGEVIRPGLYEISTGETLTDVIRNAGGLGPQASRQRIQIQRLSPARSADEVGRERFVIDVSSPQLLQGNIPAVAISDGDLVTVLTISDRVRGSVTVQGNVWSPGPMAFTHGLTLAGALRLAGGVKSDVFTGQVAISRLQSDSSRVKVFAALRDSTGAVVNDIPLQEDDEIRVYSVTEFRTERFVNVAGAVRRPGEYPFRDGMTLRDLVLQAGGLHERAQLTKAELARMPADRAGGKLAVVTEVPLDSTYLFERGPDGKYLGPPGVPAPAAVAPEATLKAYDNVLILAQPDWDLPRRVSVVGEVRLPGVYTLANKQERLSDLLTRAGGLNSNAYPAGVSFTRTRESIGRIGIDLPRVIRDPRYRDNLLLEDGDAVFVPPYRSTVVVQGAVNSAVAVAHVPGRDIDWYIRAAGGLSANANGARSWVVQPNGSVESKLLRRFLPDSRPTPQPGSTVHVPAKDPADKGTDKVQLVGSVAQVLASLLTIVVVLSNRP